MCDDEGDLLTSQPIIPAGDDTLLGGDAEELSELIDVDFDQLEEHESEGKVITEDDVLELYSPLVSLRDAHDIGVSELYGDMGVDVHEYHQEEPSKETGMPSACYKIMSF